MVRPTALLARLDEATRLVPSVVPAVAGWAARFAHRAGGRRAPWRRAAPATFGVLDPIETAQLVELLPHRPPTGGNRPPGRRVSPQ